MLHAREFISLDGNWLFMPDPADAGERLGWPETAVNDAQTVTVPHIWQCAPDLVDYQGTAWYWRRFEMPELPAGKRLFLCFDAVDYEARVWLNGSEAGWHEGGFMPFSLDITDLASQAGNLLAVQVTDPQDNGEIPIGKQGSWYTRVSGIWQSVRLEVRSALHLVSAMVRPDPTNSRVIVAYELNQEPAGATPGRYILGDHGDSFIEEQRDEFVIAARQGEIEIAMPGARLWSPDNPYLYEMRLEIGDDNYALTFGMRSVGVADGRITLNGEPLYMRGVLDQAFYPDTIYRASSPEFIKDEISKAKTMGFNLLRKHIKPEIPEYLYWADRLGMLIWAEPPNVTKYTDLSTRRFFSDLTEMVVRDFNHPAIIAWSIYNEEWGLEWSLKRDVDKQETLRRLYRELKQLDPTRPVCDNSGWTHVETDINDYHAYFVLPEQLDAWRKYLDHEITENPTGNFVNPADEHNQPRLVSEFSMWSLPEESRIKRYYGDKRPWWYVNRGEAAHQDDFKKPTTAIENVSRFGLDRIFAGFDDIALHTQKRMYRGVKRLISEMRRRPALGGYVITELSDLEWETNGWLDFFREYKHNFEQAAEFNGPLAVIADIDCRNLWCGDTAQVGIYIANDDARNLAGTLHWRVEPDGPSGSVPLGECRDRLLHLSGAFSFTVPETQRAVQAELVITLEGAGIGPQLEYRDEMTFTPRMTAAKGEVAVRDLPMSFVNGLSRMGWTVQTAPGGRPALILCASLSQETLALVRKGGRCIFLAEGGDTVAEKGMFAFRTLPRGESWIRASSFEYVDIERFPDVPLHKETGWETEGLLPDSILPFTPYQLPGGDRGVNFFCNSSLADRGTVIAGHFQGWLGQNGASIFELPVGNGSITVVTWKMLDTYGRHPVATGMVDALLSGAIDASSGLK